MSTPEPTTSIATSTPEDVFIRGRSLCRELIGHVTFTEMVYFGVLGRMPTPGQRAVLDACLVTLMEHGLTPSALTTRLVYSSAPEAMQAAVGAGLASVGSLFVGTMEGCGQLLERMLASEAGLGEEATRIAREHRAAKQPLPGFGHPQHKPDDPRTPRLLELARAQGVAGRHTEAVVELSRAVDQVYAKHITLNATGAVAAVLLDCDVPVEILRGVALVARAAGLVAHVHEEQKKPALRAIWEAAERAVPYDGSLGSTLDGFDPGRKHNR
jgi:citrate synthase